MREHLVPLVAGLRRPKRIILLSCQDYDALSVSMSCLSAPLRNLPHGLGMRNVS